MSKWPARLRALWPSSVAPFAVVIYLAILLRLILIPNPGFEADVSFWKSWGLAAKDKGVVWSLHNTNNNYPTPFAYVLGGMAWLYSLLANPHNYSQYWSNTNTWFLAVAKLPSILADFGIAAIILWLGKNARRIGFPHLPLKFYLTLAAFYLLSPLGLIDGAWWGQVDSLGEFIFLLAFIAALSRRPFLAGFIYILAVMTKLQNMIYGPVFFLFLWQLLGAAALLRAVAGATAGFFLLNIEFLLARDMSEVIASLTENYDYFPLMSLNAYNLWWIVARAAGMTTSDKYMAIGVINAKTTGLIIFSSLYLLSLLGMAWETLWRWFSHARSQLTHEVVVNRETIIYRFLTALIVVASAFFLFQTQSHDRYAFPLSVFLLLWACFYIYFANPKAGEQYNKLISWRRFIIFYGLFTLFFFYNLHTALVANYPKNGLPLLRNLTQPFITIPVSVIQILLFGVFFAAAIRIFRLGPLMVSLVVFGLMLTAGNAALLFKKPVYLSSFTPIISQTGYGARTVNMPVNASGSYKTWTPLSVQYAFYFKGVGTHAKSYLLYDLNRKFTRFTTDYGIDTEAGGNASAIFRIYGDDKLLFESEKIGRYDYPRHAEVDVAGVKMLGLVTEDGGDGITDDHTDWLNSQLWP